MASITSPQPPGSARGGGASSIQGSAVYRYCSCVDPSQSPFSPFLSRAACLAQRCPATRNSFAGDTGEWVNISLATAPGFTFPAPPAPSAFTLNLQTTDTYTSDVLCNDRFSGPTAVTLANGMLSNVTEPCRIGLAQRSIIWAAAQDVAAGRVNTGPGPQPPAQPGPGSPAGLFLSHVLTAGAPASLRDLLTGGNLRNDYEYVEGVSRPPSLVTVAPGAINHAIGCIACAAVWRPDWLFDPSNYEVAPALLRQVPFIGSILPEVAGPAFAVVRNVGYPIYDVTASLSAGVQSLLKTSAVRFLTPQEPGARGFQSTSAIQFAVLPTQWRQSAVRPVAVLSNAGQLQTVQEVTEGPEPPPPGSISRVQTGLQYVPSDRVQASAILSGTQRAVYLIGGHRPTGESTGEIWRYDIARDLWTHPFPPQLGASQRPGDVRAGRIRRSAPANRRS